MFAVWMHNSTIRFIQDWYLTIVTKVLYTNNILKTVYDVK
jgi:hypothetical protein